MRKGQKEHADIYEGCKYTELPWPVFFNFCWYFFNHISLSMHLDSFFSSQKELFQSNLLIIY